jgi:GntR family transcriptional regulator
VTDRGPELPVYRRVAEQLRAQILSGELAPGARLPAEFTLAHDFEVSRDTIRDALAVLRQDGLVATRKGSGAYVREQPQVDPVRVRPVVEVHSRMPTPAERDRWDLGEGVPVTVVSVDGTETAYPGWTRLEF